jgi:TatA/E family protein of Tat protein translocase
MPFNLSTGELLVLLAVAVVVFGGRLPDVARRLGHAIAQFRRGMSAEMRRVDSEVRTTAKSWDEPADARQCDGTGVVGGGGPAEADATPRPPS